MHDDWMMRVSYKERFPTKKEIEADYMTLPIPNDYWSKFDMPDDEYEHQILDTIFKIMNNYDINPMSTEENQQWLKDNEIRHTSMSVGDIVILDNNIYVCAVQGWKEVKE